MKWNVNFGTKEDRPKVTNSYKTSGIIFVDWVDMTAIFAHFGLLAASRWVKVFQIKPHNYIIECLLFIGIFIKNARKRMVMPWLVI